ncbi:MAG: succinate dehydrogenase / fumarate reductase cytochrome b subunit [Candidatus Krumholzibacteriia bacterium]|jgi:succinate dehydrogenase / fumarate reductase cytochrome b subunit
MASFGSTIWSSVGKKVITGVTGFALIGFVVAHLVGNLTLFIGPGAFNEYAHFLETLGHGYAIYAMEAGLFVIFVFHIVSAITVSVTNKRKAREQGYKYSKNAGGVSKKSVSSVTMMYTGSIILVFIIAHIFLFKFNAGNPHEVGQDGVKNLYKTVVTVFKGPAFTVFTIVAMFMLGMHLRHGFWSAFQSLGWANDRYLPMLVTAAKVVAVVLAIGFIIIPIYLYFTGDPEAVAHTANNLTGGH